ncbi:reductase [Nakamurella silvestris]|nr:reductase [Nakamurella silvestris]
MLGGTHHVGRNLVEAAVARGDSVTTVNRGTAPSAAPGVTELHADRTRPGELAAALGARTWDAVLDTWSGAPRVVDESAGLLAERAGHYGYVSSRSVHRWPLPSGAAEDAAVVDARADDDSDADYAVAKRGSELAVLEHFPDRSLLARAGLILGPYEIVGRLPWWLGRLDRGGRVLAPGPRNRPLQYIDGRDLAEWMLRCAETGTTGAFNAVSRPGHTTMGELLDTAAEVVDGSPELVWVSPERIEAEGIAPWTELPIWLPPTGEMAGLHNGNVDSALAAGLTNRPVAATVTATWAWLKQEGWPTGRARRAVQGLAGEVEVRVLSSVVASPSDITS